ncbi:MAG: NAD-dependent deacylase [Saprospiraceae bacterium]|nr:NAD-dependent deacylase [Saprospiraceae bacterium]
MKKLVVLTGAGISAESGIKTFRDADGLWEGHDVMAVATPQGFKANTNLVLDFYNQRRKHLSEVEPNFAHLAIKQLEDKYHVVVITQNVDDLHERAGSSEIIHLHGELKKVRSTQHSELIYDWEGDLISGDLCEKGFQLRPHIVWFGEAVPEMEAAIEQISDADLVLVIGSSMQVYPAAGLVSYAPTLSPVFYLDKSPSLSPELQQRRNLTVLAESATEGMRQLLLKL